MSIESEQAEYMRMHHKWKAKKNEIECKIAEAKSKGQDWRSLYEYQLNEAIDHAALNYELATDRGY